MKMFSDCGGPCTECVSHYAGGCLAGHGDDEFYQITELWAKRILNDKEKLDKLDDERLALGEGNYIGHPELDKRIRAEKCEELKKRFKL